MKKRMNTRKIKIYKTLEGRHIKKKQGVSPFVQVKPHKSKHKVEKSEKIKSVECFALVVIKVPWYKKAWRSFWGIFGIA